MIVVVEHQTLSSLFDTLRLLSNQFPVFLFILFPYPLIRQIADMTTPKAKSSSIARLTVTPDVWDSYPKIEYSSLSDCTFINLSDASRIDHSELADVTIRDTQAVVDDAQSVTSSVTLADKDQQKQLEDEQKQQQTEDSEAKGKKSGGGGWFSGWGRNSCDNASNSKSNNKKAAASSSKSNKTKVERSTVKQTELENTTIERSNIGRSTVEGGRVEYSEVKDSALRNSRVERSNMANSIIETDSRVERSQIKDCSIRESRIERASLTRCEVANARIDRCEFTDMVLMYGIWENGDLVGRTCKKEVIVVSKEDWENRKKAEVEAQEAQEAQAEASRIQSQPALREERLIEVSLLFHRCAIPHGQDIHGSSTNIIFFAARRRQREIRGEKPWDAISR